MLSLLPERRKVNGGRMLHEAIAETHAYLGRLMSQRLNGRLAASVDYLLGRGRYDRRGGVPADWEQAGRCQRCGSQRCDHFSRNGHRPRTLGLWAYVLRLALPRVVCQCGGSVQLDFAGLLRPYQRLGEDIDAQIQRWGAMSISLREMQAELAHSAVGKLGLRTINERLHQLQELTPDLAASQVPPILQIDAIWYTQLQTTGETRLDGQARRRAVKKGQKRPILIAMGFWPESGRREILAWELGQSEDAAAWVHFLGRLEEQGIRGANGLKLVIHDGGSGLCTALQTVDLDAAEQRCLFHKLKNIGEALSFEENLSRPQRRQQRRKILKDFQAIWHAKEYATALRRYLHVVRQYRATQPKAVATLRRDFRSTLTFYHIQQQHPTWPRSLLRATSHIERFNRRLRRHIRTANAYHSDAGILAVVAQEADHVFRAGIRTCET
jgi:transposase-like protein